MIVRRTLFDRVDGAFRRLESNCREGRESTAGQAGLADMSVKAVQILRAKERRLGYLEFLEALDQSARAFGDQRPPQKGNCTELSAALIVLLERM